MRQLAFSAFLFLSMLLYGCNSGTCISGSGNEVSLVRAVDKYNTIKVGGSIKLIVRQGNEHQHQVRITAADNLQEEISTKVRNNQLIIEMNDDICEPGPITIYATASALSGIDASGSVDVQSEGRINSTSFDLDLSGATKVSLEISCGKMSTNSSGASKIQLRGQAGSHEIEMSGSAEMEALNFIVGIYRINTSGSSNLKINVLNELDVKSSGSSNVTYRGNPGKVRDSNSGSSSIVKIN